MLAGEARQDDWPMLMPALLAGMFFAFGSLAALVTQANSGDMGQSSRSRALPSRWGLC